MIYCDKTVFSEFQHSKHVKQTTQKTDCLKYFLCCPQKKQTQATWEKNVCVRQMKVFRLKPNKHEKHCAFWNDNNFE